MAWKSEEIDRGLEDGLHRVEEEGRKETADKIRPIVYANRVRGRVLNYLDTNPDFTPQDYVFRVAQFYEELHDYVYQVQSLKASEVWLPLIEKMELWAIYYLRRSRLRYRSDLPQLAADLAGEAGARLVHAYFPFDTGFDAWANVIVQHVCGKHLARENNAGHIPETEMVRLEKVLPYLPEPTAEEEEKLALLRQDVVKALTQLPREYQDVILLRYVENLTYEQIAARIGVSLATAHRWHLAAIETLWKILGGSGYIHE